MTLRAARVNVGLTQTQAAEKIGVTIATLLNWEKGVTFPNIKQIQKMCEIYGVSYDNLNFLPDSSL